MALSYLFLILSYTLFDSSFSKEKDQACVVKKLSESIPDNIQDIEDISEYLFLLNTMCQWNEQEKYWEGIEYLFLDICNNAKKYTLEKMYTLCYYFYDVMYLRKNSENSDKAVYAIKNYITHMDELGWKENRNEYYLILWGMLNCLLRKCNKDDIVYFIRWYMDYPMRSKKVLQNTNHPIEMKDIHRQIGILLIEIELYLNSNSEINNYILEVLPNIWSEGKYFLDESEEEFIKEYLAISTTYSFGVSEFSIKISNLYSDYRNHSTRSLLMSLMQYRQEENNEFSM